MERTSLLPSNEDRIDGGYGWVVVIASFLLLFFGFGIPYSFGVVLTFLMDPAEPPYTTMYRKAAAIGSLQLIFAHMFTCVASQLVLQFGERAVCVATAFLWVLAYVSSAFLTNIYALFLTQGVLTGIGCSFAILLSQTLVQKWFEKWRATANGIVTVSVGAGMACISYGYAFLFSKIGWRNTMLIFSALTGVTGLFGAMVMRAPRRSATATPSMSSESIRSSDNIGGESNENGSRVAINISSEKECATADDTHHMSLCTQLSHQFGCHYLKYTPFTLVVVLYLIYEMCIQAPNSFVPVRAREIGIGSKEADFLVTVIGIGGVFARVLAGFLADKSRKGRQLLFTAGFIINGLASVLIPILTTNALIVTYSAVRGVAQGMIMSLLIVIAIDFVGIQDVEKNVGLMYTLVGPFALAAPILDGMITDYMKASTLTFVISGSLELVGALIAILLFRYPFTDFDRNKLLSD